MLISLILSNLPIGAAGKQNPAEVGRRGGLVFGLIRGLCLGLYPSASALVRRTHPPQLRRVRRARVSEMSMLDRYYEAAGVVNQAALARS
jgi:hypothetical protein